MPSITGSPCSSNPPAPNTIENRLQTLFVIVREIEDKIFFPKPEDSAKAEQAPNKLLDIKDSLENLEARLTSICSVLGVIGK